MKKCLILLFGSIVCLLGVLPAYAFKEAKTPDWFSQQVQIATCSGDKCIASVSAAFDITPDKAVLPAEQGVTYNSGDILKIPWDRKWMSPGISTSFVSDASLISNRFGEKPWRIQHVVGVYH